MKTAIVITSNEQLKKIVEGERAKGHRLVVTKGVYDMFHDGHAKYIRQAKEYGDVLFLGVDDDELTRKTKGEDRPTDTLETRIRILEELRSVDFIVVRTLDTSEGDAEMVSVIQPDMLVVSNSSKQYIENSKQTVQEYFEQRYIKEGGAKKLVVLDPQSSNSTTAKIRKIRSQALKEFVSKIMELAEQMFGKEEGAQ